MHRDLIDASRSNRHRRDVNIDASRSNRCRLDLIYVVEMYSIF